MFEVLQSPLSRSDLVLLGPEVTEDGDDPGEEPRGRAEAERDQHEEEEDREELWEEVELGEGGGVADEGQTGAGVHHVLDGDPELVRQAPEDGEDHEPGQEGGEGVCEADDESISVGVMPEVVVGGVGDESPKASGEGEEGLSDGRVPDLHVEELAPLRSDVEQDSLHGSRQGEALDQESDEDDVGEDGGDVRHLPRAGHALPEREEEECPAGGQAGQELEVRQTQT